MAFTLDTTLGELLDHPQAKPIVEQYIPGLASHPAALMVKGMSLNSILAMPQAAQFGLTKEKAESVLAEVNKRIG